MQRASRQLPAGGHFACDVTRNPPRADDVPVVVAQRKLARRDPAVRPVTERLSLDLPDNGGTGGQNVLLVRERPLGVLRAEDVKVGLADDLSERAPISHAGKQACADEGKPAFTILEIDPLRRIRENVAHAHRLEARLGGELRRLRAPPPGGGHSGTLVASHVAHLPHAASATPPRMRWAPVNG